MFCYTSGTTGDPKGAILTHSGLLSCMHLIDHFNFQLTDEDSVISYLPYGHTFEQCIFIFSFLKGFKTGYYSGDPLKLMEDVQCLQPTFMCSVPRILNRVYTKVMESIS